MAESMLLRMETRLKRDDRLYADYREFMSDYRNLGHMREVLSSTSLTSGPRIFIPHHPIVRESSTTTRVRVVFNASCRTASGISLNYLLLVGPKLQKDLSLILMRWRMHRFVFTANIQQMYRQILVDSRDTAYQCILWRDRPTDNVKPFELLTVTYGTVSAPYHALRVVQQLAEDEGSSLPLAKTTIENEFYVDDVLSGASTLEATRERRDQLITLLNRGKFKLHKWSANHTELLEDLPACDCSKDKDRPVSEEHAQKILGLTWDPTADLFKFNNIDIDSESPNTKRNILSIIARLFNPLGWLAPVVIIAKSLMQELWIRGTSWDSELPDDVQCRWKEYCRNMSLVTNISIPHWTGFTGQDVGLEIHDFADASRRAYAAVVYLRVIISNLRANIKIITAKTKVAPIKKLSIPRLELCATVLLARLMAKVRDHLDLSITAMHAWTDSTIVLAWLKQHPSTWKTFVANRISTIQTVLPQCSWHHVPTSHNPVDCAFRGMSVQELNKSFPLVEWSNLAIAAVNHVANRRETIFSRRH